MRPRELGLGEFAVVGHSGGAPHALAIPYRMPERVTEIVLASPVAPLDEKGMAKLMIKDLKLLAKIHHLHHIIKWGSDYSAKKAEKDKMPLHLADRLPDCTTHVWPGAGHYGFVDRERWTQLFQAAV